MAVYRLTLTWDVLKSHLPIYTVHCILININMRCIEIEVKIVTVSDLIKININMRCIEILLYPF